VKRWRSRASATCIGVASSDAAAASSADDCNGVKPPSGKNGTYAIPCAARSSMKASSFLRASVRRKFCQYIEHSFWVCTSGHKIGIDLSETHDSLRVDDEGSRDRQLPFVAASALRNIIVEN
jgi:hypothetical protein